MPYSYDDQNIFAKILRGEIPNDTVYEDEHTLAFRDIQPQAPVHVLVIPKQHIRSVGDMEAEHSDVMAKVLLAARKIAEEKGIAEMCADHWKWQSENPRGYRE